MKNHKKKTKTVNNTDIKHRQKLSKKISESNQYCTLII